MHSSAEVFWELSCTDPTDGLRCGCIPRQCFPSSSVHPSLPFLIRLFGLLLLLSWLLCSCSRSLHGASRMASTNRFVGLLPIPKRERVCVCVVCVWCVCVVSSCLLVCFPPPSVYRTEAYSTHAVVALGRVFCVFLCLQAVTSSVLFDMAQQQPFGTDVDASEASTLALDSDSFISVRVSGVYQHRSNAQ